MNVWTDNKFDHPDQQSTNDHYPLAVVSELHFEVLVEVDLDFISTLCNNNESTVIRWLLKQGKREHYTNERHLPQSQVEKIFLNRQYPPATKFPTKTNSEFF